MDGEVTQHVEYFPFGETFLEEHSNTDRTPYLFNGKELDEETQLYYYGARYYDARTSVWQSVDPPILGKFLDGYHNNGVFNSKNLMVYGYTYQNPIILVDPDGNQVFFQKLNRVGYEDKNGFEKVGTFFANSGISLVNGFIGLWNYAGDLDVADSEAGGFGEGSLDKMADDATAVKQGVQSYIRNTTWDEFTEDTGNLLSDVETYENIVGGLVGAKGLDKLSKLGKFSTFKPSTKLLKPLGRGSTGRTIAKNLKEQLAMEEIMSNPALGKTIPKLKPLSDPRWKGWVKMSNKNAHGVEIHFNAQIKNGKIINVDDFKFKD